jgi:hypothetical protein
MAALTAIGDPHEVAAGKREQDAVAIRRTRSCKQAEAAGRHFANNDLLNAKGSVQTASRRGLCSNIVGSQLADSRPNLSAPLRTYAGIVGICDRCRWHCTSSDPARQKRLHRGLALNDEFESNFVDQFSALHPDDASTLAV